MRASIVLLLATVVGVTTAAFAPSSHNNNEKNIVPLDIREEPSSSNKRKQKKTGVAYRASDDPMISPNKYFGKENNGRLVAEQHLSTPAFVVDAILHKTLQDIQHPVDNDAADVLGDNDFIPKPKDEWQVLPPSAKSVRTMNPIRAIVDPIVANIKSGEERGDGKNHISLGLGDPTAAGNLAPCPVALETILQTVQSLDKNHHAAGYVNACGTMAAREAIARFHSPSSTGDSSSSSSGSGQVTADNVVVASGCSGALELVLTALLDNGSSSIDDRQHLPSILLVPQPGFPLYQVIAESHGAMVMHYRLLPDKNWEIDLDHVRELVEQHGASSRIRGIIVNNPSNPTGAVYSSHHLSYIVDVADDCRLPIVADEVYGDLVFGKHQFHPMADMAARAGNRVPVITCSGLGKQYLIPGWRIGWAVFHDNKFGSLREIEAGTKRLAQVTMGASHLIQTVIPPLLDQTNDSNGKDGDTVQVWKQNLIHNLEEQAHFLEQQLSRAPGLEVMNAQGAMYCMIRFNPQDFSLDGCGIQNDVDFCQLLLAEENVLVLPGSCFGVANVFRVVFCAPKPILKDAADRITAFCERHYKK